MYVMIMSKEEQETIISVEDDIRVAQSVLYDDELLYDEDNFDLNRAKEALLYGAYYDDIGYVIKGLDILKEFIRKVEGFETEDYTFFNGCISALQEIVDKHIRK